MFGHPLLAVLPSVAVLFHGVDVATGFDIRAW